ncbi:hypothetical protein BDQ17DRAFT_1333435 [Cyathus striatus]|nr:hypothetical protein BDQ17DRAFT_1333435 [Cyathus striatus]
MKRKLLLKRQHKMKTTPAANASVSETYIDRTSRSNELVTVPTSIILPDIRITAFDRLPYASTMAQTRMFCSARTEPVAPRPSIPPSALICTRVPPVDSHNNNTCECVIYFRTQIDLFNTPDLGRPPPALKRLTPAYEIRETPSMGQGMFATRPLQIGDLILVERPLMVLPVCMDDSAVEECPRMLRELLKEGRDTKSIAAPAGLIEPMLELMFNRMSKENQEAFMELANAHTHDPSSPRLSSIWRTNSYELTELGEEGDKYGAIFKEMSRINHSCRFNCTFSFDPASFSCQLRAAKPIARGEEILSCYCNSDDSTTKRQAHLKSYWFSCSCLSCTTPANDSTRPSIRTRIHSLIAFTTNNTIMNPRIAREAYGACVSIMEDMEEEGMEGTEYYWRIMEMRALACFSLSKYGSSSVQEGKRWREEAKKLKTVTIRLALAHDGCFKKNVWETLGSGWT